MTLQERNEKIIDLYLNSPELSNKEIAEIFNVSTSTISRIARINNLPRRSGNTGVRLTLEQEQEIVNLYLNSTPLIKLQEKYNISYDRIKNIISRYTVDTISSAKRLNPNLIENYFESIDTPEKAYWLGLIISDGAITNQADKSKFQLELTLKKEDEHILHLLENDLGVKNKVYNSAYKYKRFSLGSKKIIQDLEKLGITQNKSFTVQIPNIPEEYESALIRGIFDGDGGFTTYIRSNGKKCMELSFCGNIYVMEWVQKTLFKNLPKLRINKITNESSIKRIRWSSIKDIILIRDFIYKNHNNHYLFRKYNLIYANTEPTD